MFYDGTNTIDISSGLGDTEAYALNNAGQAVVYASVGSVASGLYIYSNSSGTVQNIPGTSCWDTVTGINDTGVVIGLGYEFQPASGGGWSYYDGVLHDLGANFYPEAINNVGQMVGIDASRNVVLDTNGAFQNLGPLTGDRLGVLCDIGLNNTGEVAFVSNGHLMLFDGGTLQDLTSLFDGLGYTPDDVPAINDRGQILVNCLNAENPADNSGTFVLSPVPEPSTFVLLGFGAVSMMAYAWRKRRRMV
jgi:hypothetical protein